MLVIFNKELHKYTIEFFFLKFNNNNLLINTLAIF